MHPTAFGFLSMLLAASAASAQAGGFDLSRLEHEAAGAVVLPRGLKLGAELRLFSTKDNRDYEARFVDCTGTQLAAVQ